MLIDKFLGKLEKKFTDGDAREKRVYEWPLYEFVLEREVSEVRVEGHIGQRKKKNGAYEVYKIDDDNWAKFTIYPLDDYETAMNDPIDGFNKVRRVEGVTDIDKTQVGLTEWDITVDIAEGTIVDVEKETIREGYE